MQAYSADRASYDKRLEQIFHEADGDGEVESHDVHAFIRHAYVHVTCCTCACCQSSVHHDVSILQVGSWKQHFII